MKSIFHRCQLSVFEVFFTPHLSNESISSLNNLESQISSFEWFNNDTFASSFSFFFTFSRMLIHFRYIQNHNSHCSNCYYDYRMNWMKQHNLLFGSGWQRNAEHGTFISDFLIQWINVLEFLIFTMKIHLN